MYLYKPHMKSKFKFPFDGIDVVETSYSQLLQDMFALAVNSGKRNGTFVEIGADQASFINNTYLLETKFRWSGFSVDMNPQSEQSFKMTGRRARFYLGNALKLNYQYIFEENFIDNRIDYLSVDIEPSTNTFEAMKSLPLDKYRFSCITFETDYYDTATPKETSDWVRKESRKFLNDHGYVLVAGNLSNLVDDMPMEDWYMDGEYFNKYYLDKFMRDNDEPIAAHKYLGLE